jgi:hypothetical protein
MRRVALFAAVVGAGFGVAAPHTALAATEVPVGAYAGSTTNNLLSKIPGFGGGDTRHICLIVDQLDRSYCVYVPLP